MVAAVSLSCLNAIDRTRGVIAQYGVCGGEYEVVADAVQFGVRKDVVYY